MSRNRPFELDRTVDRAMTLFWETGYVNTSFDLLVSRAGTNRYRFYSTFGSKEDLLDRSLEHYSRSVFGPLAAPLANPLASLPEIQRFFSNVAALHERAGAAGCLNCNTAYELGQAGSAPARRVRRHFTRLRALFARALANARRKGELRPGAIPDYADYLVGVVAGSFLLARARMQLGLVPAFLRTALGALLDDGPRSGRP